MVKFLALPSMESGPGSVLRLGGDAATYLRITHLFSDCVYAMWVGEANQARTARRPRKVSFGELEELASSPGAQWGRLELPPALSDSPAPQSQRDLNLNAAWLAVKPLLDHFKKEQNLARHMFSRLIHHQAARSRVSPHTLRRWVLRYYYFGGSRLALLPLPTGIEPRPEEDDTPPQLEDGVKQVSQRRGPKSKLSRKLGNNTFVVSELDIVDMCTALRRARAHGTKTQTDAHVDYLATEFRKRHPDLYAAYECREHPEPVTLRQFRYYTQEPNNAPLNSASRSAKAGVYTAALYARGPGEITEIDSTGGRLFLRPERQPDICLGGPTIYIAIDRWSRYILSVYLSLAKPSYEELRYTLLVAFTSRKIRFQALDIDIDDTRWPPGKISASLCADRGPDLLSESAVQSIANDLRIEFNILPPLCPDGKAIVERLIGVLKQHMPAAGIQGAYPDRPKDVASRKTAKAARCAAVHSLAEAYAKLIGLVEDHNNRPHSVLKRYALLAQAGVPPTPKAAYQWGLDNLTGLRSPPFSDDDYYRLLLSTDTATLSKRVLLYHSRAYRPADLLARKLIVTSTGRRKKVEVRVDKTEPSRIFVPTGHHAWATFEMTDGAMQELHGVTLDEEDALAASASQLWATAEHDARRTRVAHRAADSRRRSPRHAPVVDDPQTQRALRAEETAALKQQLNGANAPHDAPPCSPPVPPVVDWQKIEQAQRTRLVEFIRQKRHAK